MTLWQTIGFYMAIAGIAVSLTTISMILLLALDRVGRWF